MKSQNTTRAPAVTLAAYMALVGSMAYAVTASAGQAAVDAHAQHECPAEQLGTNVTTDAKANPLDSAAALPADKVDAPVAAKPAGATAKAAKPSRRKNQVESALFHF